MKKKSHPVYEIRVESNLGNIWVDWFGGMDIHQEIDIESGLPVTVLFVEIEDQPALYGLLARIRDLNLTLISVKIMKKGEYSNENR